MTQQIQNVLQSWETSIMHFKKLDSWNFSDDLSKMNTFIREYEGSRKLLNYVRYCRDSALKDDVDTDLLLGSIRKALRCISSNSQLTFDSIEEIKCLDGQRRRFKDTTKSLYYEKLKFRNNENLRNIDVTIEDKRTSKKVRKIIEKRMCQAYYKQNKDTFREDSNRSKHFMKRAVSFQLYNLGQVEEIYNLHREKGTHWKVRFDQITGTYVYKKKVAYDTLEEPTTLAPLILMFSSVTGLESLPATQLKSPIALLFSIEIYMFDSS